MTRKDLIGRMLTKEQRISLEFATTRYEASLNLAEEYLSGRGFNEETASGFRLGVVDDPVPGDETFRGRLSIPYLTRSGVVDIRYRCLHSHDCKELGHSKYMGMPGRPLRLYNVAGLFSAGDYVVVTEGELDCAILTQCGIPSVGVPGTGGWKPHFTRIFEDYQRVYLFADGDEAGRKFGVKLQSEMGAIVIPMPDSMDVNDVYLKFGKDFLRSKIDE